MGRAGGRPRPMCRGRGAIRQRGRGDRPPRAPQRGPRGSMGRTRVPSECLVASPGSKAPPTKFFVPDAWYQVLGSMHVVASTW